MTVRPAHVLPVVLLAVLAAAVRPLPGSDRPFHPREGKNPAVRISVLSKHLRLMREGLTAKITIDLPAGAVMDGADGRSPMPVRKLEIVHNGTRYGLTADHNDIAAPARLRVLVPEKPAGCIITIDNQKRTYPLPLEIRHHGKEPGIVVEESPDRYCMDAARAEMGHVSPRESEAVQALALLIRARLHHTLMAHLHRGFDFCDLTHCQVYRGRSAEADDPPVSPWVIDQRSCMALPLFHARCGGHTLGSGVFTISGSRTDGVKDWISSEGVMLCRTANSSWKTTLSRNELTEILLNKPAQPDQPVSLDYDRKKLQITLKCDKITEHFAPEDFRLRINRVKGWNFLKSNRYSVSRSAERDGLFVFAGEGLGHGAGLCQHGALALARRGYSRYEIIRHYFPAMTFIESSPDAGVIPANLAYVIFSLRTGESIRTSYPSFMYRRIPAGSLFKLLITLYCGMKREDLLRDYRFTCRGKNDETGSMPDHCWNPRGHGKLDFSGALHNSCNLYFASLHAKVSREDFYDFCRDLCSRLDLDLRLPEMNNEGEFSRLLSGTDFRVTLTIDDLVALARLAGPVQSVEERIENVRNTIPPATRKLLVEALYETVRSGTAAGPLQPFGPEENYLPLIGTEEGAETFRDGSPSRYWGKTSTMLSGTNTCFSYGLFMGGDGEIGIITLLRKGNGHTASQWAVRLIKAENEQNRGVLSLEKR